MANQDFGDKVGSVEAALAHARSLLGGQPDLALTQAREVLRVAPAHPDALFLSAAALRRIGDPSGARQALLGLAADHPQAWALQFELGAACAALGEAGPAVAALTRATTLNPAFAPAAHALGDQLAIVGDLAGAEAAHARPLAGSVHDPKLRKAVHALLDGRQNEAADALGRLGLFPTDIIAARMIANAAARLDREAEVELLLADSVARAPRFAPARQHLAVLLHQQNRDTEALAHLDQLVAQDPAAAGFRGLRVVVLVQLGEFERAIEDCEHLLQAQPDQPQLWLTYGHVLKTIGRQADAVSAFRRSLGLAPGFGEAYWSLANLKTVGFDGADIAAMRGQLARTDLGGEDRIHLHFALGKALEDAGDYAGSFEHYHSGAGLRRATAPYDAEANTAFVRRTIETFTPALLKARAAQGRQSAGPIFILGLPRSGSTLIEQILASHSQVEGTKELPDLVAMARRLATGPDGPGRYPALLADLDGPALSALGDEYMERVAVHRRQGRPLFIDKFPNNFMHVGLICLILPEARIIDARRHPMACCFSAFKQHFAQGQAYSYNLGDLGRYYADYVDLMAHFDAVLPGRIHRVQYERLVADIEVEVRALLDYCGLDFEQQCLNFHQTARAVQTASSEQVRRPIYTEGVDQWRHYEPWLGPLKAALGPIL